MQQRSRPSLLRPALLLALMLAVPAVLPTTAVGAAPQAQPPDAERLSAMLSDLVEAYPGRAGVWVHHLDSGLEAGVDPDTPYPMASTFKVPIITELMTRVDAGELSLDDTISMEPGDRHIGSGLLQALQAPGVTLSLRNVATLMIVISDNSATDLLVERLGADRITARMRALGLDGIRVDRTTLELILDFLGVEYAPLAGQPREAVEKALAGFDENSGPALEAAEAFYASPKDTATARDMTDLITRIVRGEAVSPASSETILGIMRETQTGTARLRGRLPADVRIAHKTGTIGRVANDVGVLWLPHDAGTVVVSVFTLGDHGTSTERGEQLIADVARTVHDVLTFRNGS